MPFARLNRLARTLRFRLTAWNTGTILVLTVAALLGVREGLRHFLISETDQRLEEDVQEVRLIMDRFGAANPESVALVLGRKAQARSASGWFAQVFEPDGRLVHQTPSTPRLDGPGAGAPGAAVTLGSYRVLRQPIQWPGGRPVVVRVGSNLSDVQEDMATLTEMLVVAVVAMALVAPLGGYWLAGRATRPLAQIIQTTAGLRPDRLEERLPLRGNGDELDQLSATINGLLDRLADYVARKREFLANAAHELRSPLAAIRSSVEVALGSDRSTEQYKDLLGDLVEECTGLGGLVNQLLLLAESEAGRLQRGGSPQRLDLLAARAVEMFQGAAESRGLALVLAEARPALTPGEPTHLRQLLHNLIDNAIKFTPAGGRVDVGVRCEPSDGRAVLTVTDTGVGIPPEDVPHVFERFYRADKARQRGAAGRGTGLGLTICQAIVTDYGGTIGLGSTPGEGTRVTVRLPLAPVPAEAPGPA
jgi:signal transduction histidine kinase